MTDQIVCKEQHSKPSNQKSELLLVWNAKLTELFISESIWKNSLHQAYQTQTTLRAAKATKTAEGAAKLLKKS